MVFPEHRTTPARAETQGEQYGFTPASLNKLEEAIGPFIYKYFKNVHDSAGHLTSSQMRGQLAHVGGLPDETRGMIDTASAAYGVRCFR